VYNREKNIFLFSQSASKQVRRAIVSTKQKANLDAVELTPSELNSVVGGQSTFDIMNAMAKQSAINAMNDALNKSISNSGGILKNSVGW
jgi:hypothetical protein